MNQLPLMGSASIQGAPAHMSRFPTADSSPPAEVVDRIKAYITTHPDARDESSRWIEGMGWDQTKWPEAQFPTAVRWFLFGYMTVCGCN